MKNRLSKILAASGVASRRACEELIFDGKVAVNGEVTFTPQTMVDPAVDSITVSGKKVKSVEKKVYFLLNKPAGYICTTVEKQMGAKRVLDLFAHLPHRLFTAGRLDQATTGLIIVTNDGHFANQAIHPSYGHSKEYLAKTLQEITAEHLYILSEGAWIEGSHVRPLSVKKVRKGTVKIVIAEGKKHEVRTLLAEAGLTVNELTRLRIGPLSIGSLAPGQYRELSYQEIIAFNKE